MISFALTTQLTRHPATPVLKAETVEWIELCYDIDPFSMQLLMCK
jgi:hypothetical protein